MKQVRVPSEIVAEIEVAERRMVEIYAYGLEYQWRLLCQPCADRVSSSWRHFRACRHCGRRRYYLTGWPR